MSLGNRPLCSHPSGLLRHQRHVSVRWVVGLGDSCVQTSLQPGFRVGLGGRQVCLCNKHMRVGALTLASLAWNGICLLLVDPGPCLPWGCSWACVGILAVAESSPTTRGPASPLTRTYACAYENGHELRFL